MTLPRDSEGPRSYRHVSSSTVAAIDERSTRTLGIRFQRGAEYRYFSVPETVYPELRLRIPKGDTSTLGYEMLGIRFSGYTSPENSWRVPIPVQTQEPPCGTRQC